MKGTPNEFLIHLGVFCTSPKYVTFISSLAEFQETENTLIDIRPMKKDRHFYLSCSGLEGFFCGADLGFQSQTLHETKKLSESLRYLAMCSFYSEWLIPILIQVGIILSTSQTLWIVLLI